MIFEPALTLDDVNLLAPDSAGSLPDCSNAAELHVTELLFPSAEVLAWTSLGSSARVGVSLASSSALSSGGIVLASPDGRTVAVLARERRIAWSNDSRLVAICAFDGSLRVVSETGAALLSVASLSSSSASPIPPSSFASFNPAAGIAIANDPTTPTAYTITIVNCDASIRVFRLILPQESELEPPHQQQFNQQTNAAAFWRQCPTRLTATGHPLENDNNNNNPKNSSLLHTVSLHTTFSLISTIATTPSSAILITGLSTSLTPLMVLYDPTNWTPLRATTHAPLAGPTSVPQHDTPSWIAHWGDIMSDLSVHLFDSSLRDTMETFRKAVMSARVSEDGRKLVTIDLGGVLRVWDLESLVVLETYTNEELNACLNAWRRDPAVAEDGAEPAKLVSAEWWSTTELTLLFNNGHVIVSTLPLSPHTPPLHHPSTRFLHPSMTVSYASRQIFLLESTPPPPLQERLDASITTRLTTPPVRNIPGLLHHFNTLPASPTDPRLTVIPASTTLLSSIALRVSMGEYAAAEQMCFTNDVDVDLVRQSMFLHSESAEEARRRVRDVKDDKWVLDVCLNGEGVQTREEVRVRLEEVLRRSEVCEEGAVLKELEDALDSEGGDVSGVRGKGVGMVEWCLARVQALEGVKRLEVYEAVEECGVDPLAGIVGGGVGWEGRWRVWREVDLAGVVCLYAGLGWVKAVEVVVGRCWGEVAGWRLRVAGLVPVGVREWGGLLPRCEVGGGREVVREGREGWRRVDWTEGSRQIRELVREVRGEEGEGVFGKMKGVGVGVDPVDGEVVTRWHVERARRIEEELGDLEGAVVFLERAQKEPFHVAGLEGALGELRTVRDLSVGGERVTRAQVEGMEVREVVESMVGGVKDDPDAFCECLKQTVEPFLKRVGGGEELDRCIVRLVPQWMDTCLKVLEASRKSVPLAERVLVRDAEKMAELVVQCAEAVSEEMDAQDAVGVLVRLVQCLPDESTRFATAAAAADGESAGEISGVMESDGWDLEFDDADPGISGAAVVEEPDAPPTTTTTGTTHNMLLHTRVALLESRVEAIQILHKYGLHVSLAHLSSSEFTASVTTRRLLAVKMARVLVSTEPAGGVSDERWKGLARDLAALVGLSIFEGVQAAEVGKELLKVILQDERFALAKKLMEAENAIVDREMCQEVVVECAKELYDNADSGDMYRGFLKLAVDCLKTIVPPTPQTQTELLLIEATHLLHRLSIQLSVPAPLPLQIRLHPHRIDLLSSLVYNSSVAPKSIDVKGLLEIARKLYGVAGVGVEQRRVDMSVRGIVANWALDRDEAGYAVKVCEEMMDAVMGEQMRPGGGSKKEGKMKKLQRTDSAWITCVRLVREVGGALEGGFRKRLVGFLLEQSEAGALAEVVEVVTRVAVVSGVGQQGGDVGEVKVEECLDLVH
ncbi:hypothetical protein HDU98_008899, partial [Podochytrium sp. JEL0797]